MRGMGNSRTVSQARAASCKVTLTTFVNTLGNDKKTRGNTRGNSRCNKTESDDKDNNKEDDRNEEEGERGKPSKSCQLQRNALTTALTP
jgi:hypothetical protein